MGRPKNDNTVLKDAALLRWHELDIFSRDRRILDLAILDTAKAPPNGFIRDPDTLRKLLRRELCKLDYSALQLALLAARQRVMLNLQDGATHRAPVHGLVDTIAPATQSEAWGLPIHDPARPTYGLSSLTGTLPFPIQNQPPSPYEFLFLNDTFRSAALQLVQILATPRLA
jgi:hypothetical protein